MNVLKSFAGNLAGLKSWSQPPFWTYPDDLSLPFMTTWTKPDQEKIENDFEGYVKGALKGNSVVHACIARRMAIFSQARFQWIQYTNGAPGAPFGNSELKLIERPWPNGMTIHLLARAELDASIAGNFWATTMDDRGRFGHASRGGPNRRIVHMRPDWVTVIIDAPSGNPNALDAKVIAIQYKAPQVGGKIAPTVLLLPDEVCHYAPDPDPVARYRGRSWLTPAINEIMADTAATKHKLKFFENAATPNLAVSLAKEITPDQFREFVEEMDKQHKGVEHAYKTLYTAGGADVTVIGANLQQLDFKSTQGAGETRIAMDAGIHPVLVGLSEGMQGSSLNSGNFNAARRLTADTTMRYLWACFAASFQNLLELPTDKDGSTDGVELWPDLRGVSFLQEDMKDQADIRAQNAIALRTLSDAGAEWDAAVEYIQTDDLSKLKGKHTGLYSVQLQEPLASQPTPTPQEGS